MYLFICFCANFSVEGKATPDEIDMLWVSESSLFSMVTCPFEVKSDHRSKFSNLSNWKEEAWKNQGFNGNRACSIRVRFLLKPSCFQASSFQLLKLENLLRWSLFTSSTTAVQIWIISYILHTHVLSLSVHWQSQLNCQSANILASNGILSLMLVHQTSSLRTYIQLCSWNCWLLTASSVNITFFFFFFIYHKIQITMK